MQWIQAHEVCFEGDCLERGVVCLGVMEGRYLFQVGTCLFYASPTTDPPRELLQAGQGVTAKGGRSLFCRLRKDAVTPGVLTRLVVFSASCKYLSGSVLRIHATTER